MKVPTSMAVLRVVSMAAPLALAGVGCQSILGFEEFKRDPSALDTRDASTQAPVADDDDASRGPSGSEADPQGAGDACATDEDCGEDLTCLFSRCRMPCNDETDCASSSVCLFSAVKKGGCRVASESSCTKDVCDNSQLVCALDDSCRVECSETRSCDSPTQVCIAGSCVSTVGTDAERFDCGALKPSQVGCDGATLVACNTLGPGLATVETCESSAVCSASLPANKAYDPKAPPACGALCPAGEWYCQGSQLLECKQDGSGPVDDGTICATAELCELGRAVAPPVCPAPTCDDNQRRCAGSQTSLEAQECNTGRTAFEAVELCDPAGLQCNPTTAQCLSLGVDAKEVTRDEYSAWLKTAPEAGGQEQGCSWNSSFEPEAACLSSAPCQAPGGAPTAACPAVCVDWCDANAYCAAQGKRLCGKLGGGMVALDRYADPGTSEWMNACSAAGQFSYGHGSSPPETEPTACAFSGNAEGKPYPAGTHNACKSPARGYSQLFDLSGNVAEWENACERPVGAADAGRTDVCLARGGSYLSPLVELECAKIPTATRERQSVSSAVGFRCCSD